MRTLMARLRRRFTRPAAPLASFDVRLRLAEARLAELDLRQQRLAARLHVQDRTPDPEAPDDDDLDRRA